MSGIQDTVRHGKRQTHHDRRESLDHVNEEDKGCTEKVYRGLMGALTEPGHLSHLERPNFEFAQYILSKCDV